MINPVSVPSHVSQYTVGQRSSIKDSSKNGKIGKDNEVFGRETPRQMDEIRQGDRTLTGVGIESKAEGEERF